MTKIIKQRKKLSGCESCLYFIWDMFEDSDGSQISAYVNQWIMGLIVFSAVIAVVETIPSIHKSQESLWFGFESFFVANFSIEFIGRLISCPNKCDFWSSTMNWIDLVAIFPYYLDLILKLVAGGDSAPNFAFLRILRLSRAARLVKLGKYSQGIRLVTNAMVNSLDALQLFALVLCLVLVVCSSGIYYTERGTWIEACPTEWYTQFGGTINAGVYPNQCQLERYYRTDIREIGTGFIEQYPSPYQSIPQSFWWTIVTLTTVGYGDMYPYSVEGMVIGVFTMIIGLILLALPLSIIGTNFIEERNIMVAEMARMAEKERLADLGIDTAETEKEPVNLRRDLRELLAKVCRLIDMISHCNLLPECNPCDPCNPCNPCNLCNLCNLTRMVICIPHDSPVAGGSII